MLSRGVAVEKGRSEDKMRLGGKVSLLVLLLKSEAARGQPHRNL